MTEFLKPPKEVEWNYYKSVLIFEFKVKISKWDNFYSQAQRVGEMMAERHGMKLTSIDASKNEFSVLSFKITFCFEKIKSRFKDIERGVQMPPINKQIIDLVP